MRIVKNEEGRVSKYKKTHNSIQLKFNSILCFGKFFYEKNNNSVQSYKPVHYAGQVVLIPKELPHVEALEGLDINYSDLMILKINVAFLEV